VSLSFLLDEDVPPAVAAGLRARGVDAISVYEIGRAGQRIADGDQLAYAASEGRVLVTYNRDDFQALDGEWRRDGRSHAGILWCSDRIIPRRAVGAVISALEAAAQRHEALTGLCIPLTRVS
jgi:hypothetical protein